jgi:hypothetical protein
LPVNYLSITRGADSSTNYQLLPGDRVFIAEDKLLATNYFVNVITSPVNQLLGITQLGTNMVKGYQIMGRAFNSQSGL